MNRKLNILFVLFSLAAGLLFAAENPTNNDPNSSGKLRKEPSLRIKPTKTFVENRPTAHPSNRPANLRDGFVLYGEYGSIQQTEKGMVFLNQNPINDSRVTLKEQTALVLLKSSTRSAMERFYQNEHLKNQPADAQNDDSQPKAPVRLWARVTQYNGRNYLFPMHFIPMQATDPPADPSQSVQTDGENDESEITQTQPAQDEDSILPPEVLEKLKPKRVVNLALMREYLEKENDVLLVHRSGFLERLGENWTFRLDGFGTKIEYITFDLLPTQTLQNAQRVIEAGRFRQRYNISGIVTRYQGRDYLLLQFTERTYTHGNFSQ